MSKVINSVEIHFKLFSTQKMRNVFLELSIWQGVFLMNNIQKYDLRGNCIIRKNTL